MEQESLTLRFLYRTKIGRVCLKAFIRPGFSRLLFYYLDSPLSKWLIGRYQKKYRIDMRGYEKKNYTSFNDFFIRKRVPAVFDETPGHLISPCDGYLSVYPIESDSRIQIKNTTYSLQSLLKEEELAKTYQDGLCLVFRLAPYNYHRYLYIEDGTVERRVVIPGVLHCVRPIACEKFPVYIQNSREYTVVRSERLGTLLQMEIGALLVGRICNTCKADRVSRGQEKGFFEFGGSTIVVLLEKNCVQLEKEIMENSKNGKETEVTAGKRIGSYADRN